jgi:dihydrofolate reductase
MRKLSAFTHITLDGYFATIAGDMSWAHAGSDDPEWRGFVAQNAGAGGTLLFGRVTYEMMASYWPTPAARAASPAVAERMNAMPKLVASRTLDAPAWSHTRLIRDLVADVRALKAEPGDDLAILGSGSLLPQLADAGLIDSYQVVINPLALGAGKAIFAGLAHRLALRHTATRTFGNGKVLLSYARAG